MKPVSNLSLDLYFSLRTLIALLSSKAYKMPDLIIQDSLKDSNQVEEQDDEPDEWYVAQVERPRNRSHRDRDKRIFSTGCSGEDIPVDNDRLYSDIGTEENTRLNDCFFEKKDWRACKSEVGRLRHRFLVVPRQWLTTSTDGGV